MTELAKKLKSVLTDTPQSRERLAYLCGCSDSQLRAAKKELVDSGICVCSNSHTTGYWMGNEKEIEHTIKEMLARSNSLRREALTMAAHYKVMDQMEWSV